MAPARKKAIVYRVTGIPIGDKAQSALQDVLDDEDTNSNVRSKLEQALNGPPSFAKLSKDDQAIAFLRFAVQTELLQDPEMDAQRFHWKLIPSVYDPHRYRSALLWFPKVTPSFLKGLETKPRMEMHITVDSVFLTISRAFYGFTQLYEPSTPVFADVIALTGLGGHAFGSWKGHETGAMWLCDWFPEDFPAMRTLIYGYAGGLSDRNVSSIQDYVKVFMQELEKIRTEEEKERPVYLIGHSFGGLLIDGILIEDDMQVQKLLVPYVKGLFFFGVPHQGFDITPIKEILPKDSVRLKLIEDMSTKASAIHLQYPRLHSIICREKIQVRSFYERVQTPGLEMTDQGLRWSEDKFQLTVKMKSATLNVYGLEKMLPVDGNHSTMVKFNSNENPTYTSVKKDLARMIRSTNTLISPVAYELSTVTDQLDPKVRLPEVPHIAAGVDLELQELMSSLHDPVTFQRLEDVAPPASGTFGWIWENEDIGFSRWMEGRKGIFWISGHPASGKSTIMRSTYHDQRTADYIKTFGRTQATKAGFFFHDRGVKEQKSIAGLLHSTLWTILSEIPDLQSELLPIFRRLRPRTGAFKWTENSLRTALLALKVQQNCTCHILLFIDALDEYDGKNHTISRFIKQLAEDGPSKTSFQLCISSREEVSFLDAFSNGPHCQIHLHTKEDMRTVIRTSLEMFPKLWDCLATTHSRIRQREDVVEHLVGQAQGVFLWTALILEELKDGMEDGDSGEQLYDKLDQLPRDLKGLYQRMMTKIPKKDIRRAHVMIEIISRWKIGFISFKELSVLVHLALCERKSGRFLLTADDEPWKGFKLLGPEQLRVICRGFLVVANRGFVTFLHQTTKEFFRAGSVWKEFLETDSIWKDVFPGIEVSSEDLGHIYICRGALELATGLRESLDYSRLNLNTKRIVDYLSYTGLEKSKPDIMIAWVREAVENANALGALLYLDDADTSLIDPAQAIEFAAVSNKWENVLRRRIEQGYRCPKQEKGLSALSFAVQAMAKDTIFAQTLVPFLKLLIEAGAKVHDEDLAALRATTRGPYILRFSRESLWDCETLFTENRAHNSMEYNPCHEQLSALSLAIKQLNFERVDFLLDRKATAGLNRGLSILLQELPRSKCGTVADMINHLLDRGATFDEGSRAFLGGLLLRFPDLVRSKWLLLEFHNSDLPEVVRLAVEQNNRDSDGHKENPLVVYCRNSYTQVHKYIEKDRKTDSAMKKKRFDRTWVRCVIG